MAAHDQTRVVTPASFQELFSFWENSSDAVPLSGGVEFMRGQAGRLPVLPRNILSLSGIKELRHVTRTERYLELGAKVPLSGVLGLGAIVPEILQKVLKTAACPQVRAQATIGGSLCVRSDVHAPLIALDARLELRSAAAARWISAARFSASPGIRGQRELITKVRIPLEDWNYSTFRKFESGGVIVFIARNQKNTLAGLRLVYAGDIIIQERDLESLLIGRRLPLDAAVARDFTETWTNRLGASALPPLLASQIANFARSALREISVCP